MKGMEGIGKDRIEEDEISTITQFRQIRYSLEEFNIWLNQSLSQYKYNESD